MKKLFLILFALIAVSTLRAQESAAPDYNDIRQKIFNPKHPNYYPALVKRYLENLDGYDKIYILIETQTHFYIMMSLRSGCVIGKADCTHEQCLFIREHCEKRNCKSIRKIINA